MDHERKTTRTFAPAILALLLLALPGATAAAPLAATLEPPAASNLRCVVWLLPIQPAHADSGWDFVHYENITYNGDEIGPPNGASQSCDPACSAFGAMNDATSSERWL